MQGFYKCDLLPLATRAPFHGAARGSQTHLILITSEVHDRYARAAKSCFQWEGSKPLFPLRRRFEVLCFEVRPQFLKLEVIA